MNVAIDNVVEAIGRSTGRSPKKTSSGWQAHCPTHEDRKPSLSISEADDGKVLLKCHAGCSTDRVLDAAGLQKSDLFPDSRQSSQNHGQPIRTTTRKRKKDSVKSSFASIADTLKKLNWKLGEHSHCWIYKDSHGEDNGATIRWDTTDGKEIRPLSLIDGSWTIKAMPCPRPLYQLPSISEAERVFVVEGEKCADAMASLGFVATTSTGGARAVDKTDWSSLEGKEVIVIPDNDQPGEDYANEVASVISNSCSPSCVRIVDLKALWPESPEKGDVADWVEHSQSTDSGELAAQLLKFCLSVEPFVNEKQRNTIERFEPFPVDIFPAKMRKLVSDGANSIGCDPASIAVPLLTTYGAAIGNTRRLRLKNGWDVPPIIWSGVVGKSGSGKTPAWSLAMSPTHQIEKQAKLRHGKEFAKWMERHEDWQKEHAAWKKGGQEGPEPTEDPAPELERHTVVDTTVESLVPLLELNERGLLLTRDELSGWVGSFDRYAKGGGGDASHWLSMFNAASIRVDRKTGIPPTVYVPSAAVSICGGIQPGILSKAFGSEHRENGLLFRFLLTWPPHRARKWNEHEISGSTIDDVADALANLYGLDFDLDRFEDQTPQVLHLSRESKDAFTKFYDEHDAEQQDLPDDLASVWSKLEEYAARFALILHFACWAEDPESVSSKVDGETMENAIRLVRWFCNETRRVYRMLASGEEDQQRDSLIQWIDAKGGDVTVRETQTGHRRLKTTIDAEEALNELVKEDFGFWIDVPPGAKGGRPTRKFRLNA